MSSLIKKEKTLVFKEREFNYEELNDLKYAFNLPEYQDGEVFDKITGEVFDLKNIKDYLMNFIIDIKEEVKNNPTFDNISNQSKRYMVGFLSEKANADFIKHMESINVDEAKDEDVIMYWKIKKQVLDEKDIVFNWNFKDFFKYNILFDLSSFSLLERGRILSLLYFIDYNDTNPNVKFNRESIMKIMEFETVEKFRAFFKKLETHEIIFRSDKTSKKTIDIVFNPFLILKGNSKNITYEITQMFKESSKKYLGELAVKYLKIEHDRMITGRVEIEESSVL